LASTKNPFADLKNQVKKSKKIDEEKATKNSIVEKKEGNTTNNTKINTEHNTNNSTNIKKTEIKQEVSIVIPEKKSDEKVRRNFYVNKGLDKELNKLARKTGNSKSELVDIAIEFLINNYRTE
jgi:hypothetical protein